MSNTKVLIRYAAVWCTVSYVCVWFVYHIRINGSVTMSEGQHEFIEVKVEDQPDGLIFP